MDEMGTEDCLRCMAWHARTGYCNTPELQLRSKAIISLLRIGMHNR